MTLYPKNWDFSVSSVCESIITLRANLANEEESLQWIKEFGLINNTCWIVGRCFNNKTAKRYVCRKRWVCQRNRANKHSTNGNRCTECKASVDIKVKLTTRMTKRNDPYLKLTPPLQAVIKIGGTHNHPTDTAESLRLLRPAEDTRDIFYEYFRTGLTPAGAYRAHQKRLLEQDPTRSLFTNSSINPPKRAIYHWHERFAQMEEDSSATSAPDAEASQESTSQRFTERIISMMEHNSEVKICHISPPADPLATSEANLAMANPRQCSTSNSFGHPVDTITYPANLSKNPSYDVVTAVKESLPLSRANTLRQHRSESSDKQSDAFKVMIKQEPDVECGTATTFEAVYVKPELLLAEDPSPSVPSSSKDPTSDSAPVPARTISDSMLTAAVDRYMKSHNLRRLLPKNSDSTEQDFTSPVFFVVPPLPSANQEAGSLIYLPANQVLEQNHLDFTADQVIKTEIQDVDETSQTEGRHSDSDEPDASNPMSVFQQDPTTSNVQSYLPSSEETSSEIPGESEAECTDEAQQEGALNCSFCSKYFSNNTKLQNHVRKHTSKRPFRCVLCEFTCATESGLHSHSTLHTGVEQFQCLECNECFTHRSLLLDHLPTHFSQSVHPCDKCELVFGTEKGLNIHRRGHGDSEPSVLKCHTCDESFTEFCLLQSHMQSHSSTFLFPCDKCGAKFINESGLNMHLCVNHIEPFTCSECDNSFSDHIELESHFQTVHLNNFPYQCDKCDEKFKTDIGLRMHSSIHIEEGQYLCIECGVSFADSDDLQYHREMHAVDPLLIKQDNSETFHQDSDIKSNIEMITDVKNFPCPDCSKSFSESHQLRCHRIQCHTKVSLACDICGEQFTRMSALMRHLTEHTGIRLHQCGFCSKSFNQASHLAGHIRRHTGEKPYKCEECRKVFYTRGLLRSHSKIHAVVKPFVCSLCSMAFRDNLRLQGHMKTHEGMNPFKCTVCDKVCTSNSSLIIHSRVHTGERPFKCALCTRSFAESGNLRVHLKTHIGVEVRERPFKCNQCSQGFSEKASLKKHLLIHTGEKPFPCPECGKRFIDKSNLTVHMKMHSGVRYKCDECDKTYSSKGSLKAHRTEHTGVRLFSCTTCGKAFNQRGHLRAHIRIHTGDRPFKCTLCEKAFTSSSILKVHLNTHAGIRSHPCTYCTRSFADNSHLQTHIRTHFGIQLFMCDACGKPFSTKNSLTIHCRLHTGETPFVCPQCGEGFRDNRHLQKHIKKHPGIHSKDNTEME